MNRLSRLKRSRRNRAFRVRRRVTAIPGRLRLSVHRTNQHIYAQVVDDLAGKTLCATSSKALGLPYGGNVAAAKQVGSALGEKMKTLEIGQVGFDRGAYRYHGRVKALADAVREAGIKF